MSAKGAHQNISAVVMELFTIASTLEDRVEEAGEILSGLLPEIAEIKERLKKIENTIDEFISSLETLKDNATDMRKACVRLRGEYLGKEQKRLDET